jgi:hypothetical protein
MASVDHPLSGVNPEVFNDDLWAWIESNSTINTIDLRLKYGTNEPYSSAIAQIEAKNKYTGKFSKLFEERWIFPIGVGLEQSSSLRTAAVKARFFQTPYSADLCAGMGIDSRTIVNTEHCLKHLCFEQNPSLARLLIHNLPTADVIPDAFDIDKLKDWISEHNIALNELTVYLDPDRRISNKKTFSIAEGTPNLIELQKELLNLSACVVAKHSPMLDLKACMQELQNLHELVIVQYQGECKEVLTVQRNEKSTEVAITLIEAKSLTSISGRHIPSIIQPVQTIKKYIIQPSSGLNKSSLHALLAQQLDWERLIFGTLYTSNIAPNPSPFYKVFEIKSSFSSFKTIQLEGAYAIESIGSKITAKELRKRLQLREGREQKLFYLQNGRTKQILAGILIE